MRIARGPVGRDVTTVALLFNLIGKLCPIPHDKVRYRKRHKIENMLGKLKDWRRIHTRYDRCAQVFLSAIAIAAIVIFWL